MTTVTCNNCGWVHFEVSREFAENSIHNFNVFYTKASEETKAMYGGKPSSMVAYMKCFRCGGPYTNFRDSKEGDCPNGCTIQPILDRKELFPREVV